MTITVTRTTATRVKISLDGCSDYYGGALVQGNYIGTISLPLPAEVPATVEGVEQHYRLDINELFVRVIGQRNYSRAERKYRDYPTARVIGEIRKVQ